MEWCRNYITNFRDVSAEKLDNLTANMLQCAGTGGASQQIDACYNCMFNCMFAVAPDDYKRVLQDGTVAIKAHPSSPSRYKLTVVWRPVSDTTLSG